MLTLHQVTSPVPYCSRKQESFIKLLPILPPVWIAPPSPPDSFGSQCSLFARVYSSVVHHSFVSPRTKPKGYPVGRSQDSKMKLRRYLLKKLATPLADAIVTKYTSNIHQLLSQRKGSKKWQKEQGELFQWKNTSFGPENDRNSPVNRAGAETHRRRGLDIGVSCVWRSSTKRYGVLEFEPWIIRFD